MRSIVVLILSFVFTNTALAESYFGVNYATLKYAHNNIEVEPTAIIFSSSTDLSSVFELQGRAGFSISDDSRTDGSLSMSGKVENFFGVYALANLNIHPSFKPYGVVGISRNKFKGFKSDLGSLNETEFSASYGLGVNIVNNEPVALNLEYMIYHDKDGVEVNSLSLGFKANF